MKYAIPVKFALGLAAASALILGAQIDRPAAQIDNQLAAVEATKGPLTLSEQDKDAVIKAAVEAKSHQKTPKEFTPAVGATVPKEVYLHDFKPDVARETPALKLYKYAYLDREIVLVEGLQQKVVALIPLPEKLQPSDREHHGAAEAESESKGQGKSSTDSVPAYTSPEGIK